MNSLIQRKRAIPLCAFVFALVCVELSSSLQAVTPVPDAGYDTTAKTSSDPRTLTFAERVAFQRAIEEVYWRHRIWPKENPGPKPSLNAVISEAQLENKVAGYLRDSETLENQGENPIRVEQLQAEMDRMTRDTKQRGVLRELFEALGNDPVIIAECLARPVLAERLLADLSVEDEASGLAPPPTNALGTMSVKTRSAQVTYTLPKIADAEEPFTDNTWTATSTRNSPHGRSLFTVVWTGSEMVVWGGTDASEVLNTGGKYIPSIDSWTATSAINAPAARYGHTAVWTGTEMIVWGGNDYYPPFYSGGKYNPATDTWTATNFANAPDGRLAHTAIWTGSEMIVWGGYFFQGPLYEYFNTGGRYNPSTDSWTASSTTNAPSARAKHMAEWTGSEMIVWGGEVYDNGYGFFNTGGRYNPSTDSWTATNTANAPEARSHFTAVWTGSEMIVWGGYGDTNGSDGGRYNPGTDNWTATSMTNAPEARFDHTAVWTGSEMVVWGGFGNNSLNTGGRYNPVIDTWTPTNLSNVPRGRQDHTAIWTGSEMIVWGGYYGGSPGSVLNTGGRYCAPSETVSYDLNGDGHPDYVLYNASTRRTAIWYLDNNVYLNGRYGPTLPTDWVPVDVANFPGDAHPDFVLRKASTRNSAIWYLNNNVYVAGVFGPTPPNGWQLVATADFNGDGNPDYALYSPATRQTAIWYLNNNVYVGGAHGPTLPVGWSLVGLADFNGDEKTDYLLFNSITRQSAIWYLNNNVYVSGAFGPVLPGGWQLVGAADFNGDGHPDYALFNATTHQTAIWYLNNNLFVSGIHGPTLPPGWSLVAP